MPLSSNASNVLLAKCRARFGVRLTKQDIAALTGCRTVQETAAYLKNSTHYGKSLENIDPSVVHRRQLEAVLREKQYEDFSSLCRYELSVGEWFGDYILMRGEIQQIMIYLRLFAAGKQKEFIFSLPEFYIKQYELDIPALTSAKNYGDFLAAMRKSRFIRVLRTFTPDAGEHIDLAVIEHALYRHFYENIVSIIREHYRGSARQELEELIFTQVDILNFCHIYRMKKYYGAKPDSIRAWMLSGGSNVRQSLMFAMIDAETAEDALRIFTEKTGYGRLFSTEDIKYGGIEVATRPIIFGKALRLLRSSVNPTTVLLSFITLTETELSDVITIIEGVHYGLEPSAIYSLLTIDNFYD